MVGASCASTEGPKQEKESVMIITMFQGAISDAATTLALTVQRADSSIIFTIDGDALPLTVDEAARLARAGVKLEDALFRSRRPPKDDALVFEYKIHIPDGKIALFELGLVADPPGVSFQWGAKRLVLGLSAAADLLFAISRIAEAIDAIRRASRPTPTPAPRPGQRWETWQPQHWRPDGPLGDW
jgi:hypothetical protein